MPVQIFGTKGSQATRAAERFFKERRTPIQLVELNTKPMSPGEIKRFVDRFTLAALVDTASKSYTDAGFQYMKMSDADLLAKIERDPKLLRLPLVRSGNLLSIGHDPESWKAMAAAKPR